MRALVVGVDVRIVSGRAERKFAPLKPLPSVSDKWSCFYCGVGLPCDLVKVGGIYCPAWLDKRLAEDGGWALDHAIPKSRGGSDRKENLVYACTQCNVAKGTMTLEEFRQQNAETTGQPVVFYGETL